MSLSKTNTNDQKLYLDDLPNELLYMILKNLSIKEKISVERVCKKWRELLQSLYLSHNSIRINNGWSLGHFNGCSDQTHSERTGDVNFLRKWSDFWSFRNELTKTVLSPIMKRCPNFKSIHLENCRIDYETFLWMIEESPKLECIALIEISGFCLTEWQLIAQKLAKKLKHFAVSDCENIFSQGLVPIIPPLEELVILYHPIPLSDVLSYLGPNIRKLSVKCCEDSNVDAIKSLALGYGKNITHLTIDDPWIDDEIQTLKLVCRYLRNLEYLSIGFGAFSPAIRPIIELKKLRHLELNANLDRWCGILSLPQNSMNRIQTLLLNAYFGPQYLVGIENIFPNLRHLKLYFYCDCHSTVRMYYNCHSCHQKCFVFIDKLKYLKHVWLNGESYVKKIKN